MYRGFVKTPEGKLACPQCGAEEKNKDVLNVRVYILFVEDTWFSRCLICNSAGKANKGWFITEPA